MEHTRIGRFSWGDIAAAGGSCFRSSSLPGAVWITEVDFHIRGHREGLVLALESVAVVCEVKPA